MKQVAAIFALIAFLVCAQPAFSEATPAIQATVTPDSGTVGDIFTYSAQITWPEGLEVVPPEPSDQMGECRVLSRKVSDLQQQQGIFTLDVTLEFSCYKSGEQALPALQIHFLDGEDKRTEQGPALSVNIFRTLPADAKDPKGLKGQRQVAPDYLTPLAIAAGILLTALIFYAILSRVRRRKKKEQKQIIEAPDPYPYAMDRFDSETLNTLLVDEDFNGFYTELTDILREYLEGRFDVQALEMSSSEIARALREIEFDGFLKTDVRTILDRADLAKFARLFPNAELCREDLNKGRAFVEKTRLELPDPNNSDKKEGAA